jgi:hypothetical protein
MKFIYLVIKKKIVLNLEIDDIFILIIKIFLFFGEIDDLICDLNLFINDF